MTIDELKEQLRELRAQYADSTRTMANELSKLHERAYLVADNLHKMHERVTALEPMNGDVKEVL